MLPKMGHPPPTMVKSWGLLGEAPINVHIKWVAGVIFHLRIYGLLLITARKRTGEKPVAELSADQLLSVLLLQILLDQMDIYFQKDPTGEGFGPSEGVWMNHRRG